MNNLQRVAVLYQATPPPPDEWGTPKPMKKGGYKDSGADIGFCLRKCGVQVVTIAETPKDTSDEDWPFPDSVDGISLAISRGANVSLSHMVLTQSVYGQILFCLQIILCTSSLKKGV